MSSLLIADIGGTSSRWALLRAGAADLLVEDVPGYNPATGDANAFTDALAERFHAHPEMIAADRLIIYGAGCGSDQRKTRMSEVLYEVWPGALIEVESDLLGAARALFGNNEGGLVLILGTGMNAGWGSGKGLRQPMPSLGYFLGDEGSGADLGRHLLNAIYYDRLPRAVVNTMFPLGIPALPAVLEDVYRSGSPARAAASYALKLAGAMEHEEVVRLIEGRFRALAAVLSRFFVHEMRDSEVRATGSIAWGFQGILGPVLKEKGMILTDVQRSPLPGLVRYHAEAGR